MKTTKLGLSLRATAIIVSAASTLGLTLAICAPATAASSIKDHLWKFASGAATKTIDFNKGASKIYDNFNLHVATDDNIYLDAPKRVYIQKNAQIGDALEFYNTSSKAYKGTRIYDNGQLHIVTDDHLYLDASQDVNVSNALLVSGDGQFYQDLTVDGNLIVQSDITLGSAGTDDLTVNADAQFNGTLTVEGEAVFNDIITFNQEATFNGDVIGGSSTNVDLSSATSFRAPVAATSITDGVTPCSITGQIMFSTNDNHFYGCDGTNWQIFDN